MKFSLWCLLALSSAAATASAFTVPSAAVVSSVHHPHLWSFSSSSSSSSTKLQYDIQRDNNSNEEPNVWSVLASTERWISETLSDSNQGINSTPLSRKEVSYVCETSTDAAMVLANIFRKLKEARQLGETHGEEQEEFQNELSNASVSDAPPSSSLRQTQVLVIPSSPDMHDWVAFDSLVTAINQARRSARDYVTDSTTTTTSRDVYNDDENDTNNNNPEWVVSVNCAHLHPSFGTKTPQQELKELQEEEEQEVDLNLQAYKERRLQARRSPFPSIVVEVRAMPPPVYTPPPPSGPTTPLPVEEYIDDDEDDDYGPEGSTPDADFVQQLEMLFSKSTLDDDTEDGGASSSSSSNKDGFYDSIGSHLKEISTLTPMDMAQNWIAQHDAETLQEQPAAAFTISDTPQVDEAYEFLFTNLAMQSTQFLQSSASNNNNNDDDAAAPKRQYMVLNNFCTRSATSLEKFVTEATNIISTLPSLKGKVDLEWFHPEHIQPNKRCPVPVIALQWKD